MSISYYGHSNIIKYCDRPFTTSDLMDIALVKKHNEVVKDNDTVIHCGDFTLHAQQYAEKIIKQLNGKHIFITGSHDKWMQWYDLHAWEKVYLAGYVYEKKINDKYLVACHYAMRVWPRSHYGSIQVYGHTHGKLEGIGRQLDVGVDSHDFYPVSLDQVIELTKNNLNLGETNGKEAPSPRI